MKKVTTYKQPSNVSGLSINDIMNLTDVQVSSMNRTDLSRVVSRLASAANKRLKRFEKADIVTPATAGVEKSGGAFSVKEKNVNQLRAEYMRARSFLKSETSTQPGYKKFKKEFEKRTGLKWEGKRGVGGVVGGVGLGVSEKNRTNLFWRLIHELEKQDKNFVKYNYKETYEMVNELANEYQTPDNFETAALEMLKRKQEIYEANELDIEYDGLK